jgi:hypothetical protein
MVAFGRGGIGTPATQPASTSKPAPNFLKQLAPFLGVSEYEPGDSYWGKVSKNWASNPLNPIPQTWGAISEGRKPTREEMGTDAGFLATGFLPVGKAASQLNAIVRRLNKSEDVTDFMTDQALRTRRPNDAYEGLYRPGAQSFDHANVPEPASPYTFGLVPTEKLAPLREFDRWNEMTEGPIGRGNVKKLMDHMASGGKLNDPLSVSYFPETGAGYLAEGNHRLAMAEQLGLEQLPVRIWRNPGELGRQGVGRNIGEMDVNQLARTQFPDFGDSVGNYYVPPEMHPFLLKYFQPGQ